MKWDRIASLKSVFRNFTKSVSKLRERMEQTEREIEQELNKIRCQKCGNRDHGLADAGDGMIECQQCGNIYAGTTDKTS